ncbi:hypothetical protein BGP_3406 [Beggiatoa sp. PS]|nr:hypothetical protein BGP_3406 [Beggiatoa sp. PS]
MPSPIEDVILAAGGKYLIFKFNEPKPQLGIFDVEQSDWVKTLNMTTQHFKMAANQDKLIIGLQETGELQRYNLETFEQEITRQYTGFKIQTMALGWDSNDAPMLVLLTPKERHSKLLFSEQFVFIDVNSMLMSKMEVNGWKSLKNTSEKKGIGGNHKFLLRASANGKIFTGWEKDAKHSYIIQLENNSVYYSLDTEAGDLVPNYDGTMIYTQNKGIVDAHFNSKVTGFGKGNLIPSLKGEVGFKVNYGYKDEGNYRLTMVDSVNIYRIKGYQYQQLTTLDDFSEMKYLQKRVKKRISIPQRGYDPFGRFLENFPPNYYDSIMITNYGNPDQLTDKQRFWLFPDLNRLITIPYSNDRLVIREVNLEP